MEASRITELSHNIASGVAEINAFLTSHDLPSPSFDPNTPPRLLMDRAVIGLRQQILEATEELHALMLGPVGILTNVSHNSLMSLQAIHRYKIAERFPHDKDEALFSELAEACDLDELLLRRLLRHAMSHYVFREPRKGFVAHTAASKVLASSPNVSQWLGMVSDEMWPAATRTLDALSKWPGSQEPQHSGFNIAHNTSDFVFNALAKDQAREQRYAAAMAWFTTAPGMEVSHMVNSYPWNGLEHATVVDVGGSHGAMSYALAERLPHLTCVVQDLPEVAAKASKSVPPELAHRVSFMPHDFFTQQPVVGADMYLFRWVMHDWSDKYAINILRALIPALKYGARVVINEFVLPEPGTMSPFQERFYRTVDLSMLEFHNAKERNEDDWIQLFRDADEGFEFQGVMRPPFCRYGIIEAQWKGAAGAGNV